MAKCVYCIEKEATTRDHVVSENLFPKSYNKKNMITVPSDLDCNKGYSLDEEYFRNVICGVAIEHSPYANELFFSKIERSMNRRPWIARKLLTKMELIDLYTKSGLYLGEKTKFNIVPEDEQRIFNVLTKYIKGLFYHEFKIFVPEDYKIKHFWGRDEQLPEIFKHISKWNLDNKEIFAYGYNFISGSYKSIWVTIFYDYTFFISFVATEEELKRFNNSKILNS